MKRWKSSIFPDHKWSSILPLLIYQKSAAQYWSPRIHGDILDLSLIENYHFINTLTFMPTKQFQLSNAWKSLVIPLKTSFLNKNNFYTGVVSFLLPYMDSNFGFTRKCHYHICLEFSTIYNKELPFGFLEGSGPLHPLRLKPLLDLYPSIFTYISSVVKLN